MIDGNVEVLIVEDRHELRRLYRQVINDTPGYMIVGEADNGRDAIVTASALQPDVILLDIAMPKMNGIDALPFIRHACPRTVILWVSAFENEIENNIQKVDGYIVKGASFPEMFTEIERAMSSVRERTTV